MKQHTQHRRLASFVIMLEEMEREVYETFMHQTNWRKQIVGRSPCKQRVCLFWVAFLVQRRNLPGSSALSELDGVDKKESSTVTLCWCFIHHLWEALFKIPGETTRQSPTIQLFLWVSFFYCFKISSLLKAMLSSLIRKMRLLSVD
jgi:hypothetical protein